MGTPQYFRLTALPVLDPPPADPPLSLEDFYRDVPAGRPGRLARMILLSHDLLLREALRSGEIESASPVVLSQEQLRGDAPVPAELEPSSETPEAPAFPQDALWSAYYRHAVALADAERSGFLREWVGWEVGLRNALAIARARALGMDPGRYAVALDLQQFEGEAEAAEASWSAATDPLTGLQALLMASWRWIDHREPWFTFEDDEFAAYAAKLVLLHRWHRSVEPEVRPAGVEAGEAGV